MIAILVLMLEFMILGFLKGTFGYNESSIVAFVMIAVFSVAYIFSIKNSNKLSAFSTPLIAGYIWRLFLLFFDIYGKSIYGLPNSGYDSEMYYKNAVAYVYTGNAGRGGMFSTVMGEIFTFIGANRLYGQFISMLTSIVSLCVLAMILCLMQNIEEQVKYKTVTIIALLPNFAILSSIFLRESIITMLISISLYFFIKWLNGGSDLWFIISFIFAFIAASFHSGSASIAIGYIAARLIYDNKEKKLRLEDKNIVLSSIFVVIIAFLYINYADVLFGKMNNINSICDVGSTNDEGGSSYAAYVGNSNSVLNMIIYTIPRIVYFLFSPFPWQWRSIADIIAFLFSSLFFFTAIVSAIRHIYKKSIQKDQVIVLLIVSLCTAFVFAWGVTNTGTAIRHRDKMIILYAVLFVITNKENKVKIPPFKIEVSNNNGKHY